MRKPNHFRPISALLAVLLVAWVLAPGSAFAQTSKSLARYLSGQNNSVVGLNVDALRKSKYFSQALGWVKSTQGGKELLNELAAADVDIATDINTLVVGMTTASPDPTRSSEEMTVALAGTFDAAKILALIKSKDPNIKSTQHDKHTFYSKDKLTFTFPQKGVLWVSTGSETYRKGAVASLISGKNTVTGNTFYKKLINQTKSSRGVWVIADLKASQNTSAGADIAALSVDISSGLLLDILMEVSSEKEAAKAVKELRKQVQQAASQPMIAMMGAAPLLANLKVEHTGKRIAAATTMTTAEFDKLVQVAGQLLMAKLKGQPATKAPGAPASKAPGKPASPKKGAAADFN